MKLTENFIIELFFLALKDVDFYKLVKKNVKIHQFPKEEHKKLYKKIGLLYETNQEIIPSIGVLSQSFSSDDKVLLLLKEISRCKYPNKKLLTKELESFCKDLLSREFNSNFVEIFNRQELDKIPKLTKDFAEAIETFSLVNEEKQFLNIFGSFKERHDRRIEKLNSQEDFDHLFIPTGIAALDQKINGGVDVTDTVLFLAQSGAGKSTFLRFCGVHAARLGYKVLHFQLEGSEEECEAGYDAVWSSESFSNLLRGTYSEDTFNKMAFAADKIFGDKGDVSILAWEEFESCAIPDIVDAIESYIRINGEPPHLILVDYLELVKTINDASFKPEQERQRRRSISRYLKNIATKYRTRVITATQASDIDPTLLNNPDFHMTRHNVAEFKAIVDPFSIFVTYNQTSDELDNNLARLFLDKSRKSKRGSLIQIAQNYDSGKFYDAKRTARLLSEKMGVRTDTSSDSPD